MANYKTHPKKNPSEKRTSVPLSLNEAERDMIDQCAAIAGLTRTDYVLSLIHKTKEYKALQKALKAAKAQSQLPGQLSIEDLT